MKILNSISVYKNFVTADQVMQLKDYANKLFEQKIFLPNPAGPFRYFIMLNKHYDGMYMTPIIEDIFLKIATTLGIDDPKIDPMLGIIASYIQPGGFIHKHVDAYSTSAELGKSNFRFNLMIDRGLSTDYDPIINNNVYNVDIGDAWSFDASKYMHETKSIPGPEPRIVYQFGFLV